MTESEPTTARRATPAALALIALALLTRPSVPAPASPGPASSAPPAPATRGPSAGGAETPLLWHVRGADGRDLDSHGGDDPINPASVVKVATTLWALDRLGPDHRFETRFAVRGKLDRASGVLQGDLVVRGDADPDFHVENAYLVAAELNSAGLREVRGSLLVDERFWIGWEGGSERRYRDPAERSEAMATRLREALDPARWKPATRRALDAFSRRRGFGDTPAPSVVVRGGVGRAGAVADAQDLVRHRSNPLVATLKRFNSFSNNDIERFELTLGSAEELAAWIGARWGGEVPALRFATLSGLGTNRMTPRSVVRLLEDLHGTCRDLKLDVRQVLPSAGCDPGTLEGFSALGGGRTDLVAKTGTLTRTDGGVTVLAGFLGTRRGDVIFCVAEPRSGPAPAPARRRQQSWLLDLIERNDGARPADCGATMPYSDDGAEVSRLP